MDSYHLKNTGMKLLDGKNVPLESTRTELTAILLDESVLSILVNLMKFEELNITRLKQRIGGGYSKLQEGLNTLIDLKMVAPVPCCIRHKKIYRIEWNETTRFIQMILDRINSLNLSFLKQETIQLSEVLKVLQIMVYSREISASQVARKIRRRYSSALKILSLLRQENIIIEVKPYFKGNKIFQLNEDNELSDFVKGLFIDSPTSENNR